MAKFVIRPATAADCSDILRLIKVAEARAPPRAGGGSVSGRVRVSRRFPLLPQPRLAAPLWAGLWEEIAPRLPAAPPALSRGAAGPGPHLVSSFSPCLVCASPQELAKYEYMEEQVMLTEKGNTTVGGEGRASGACHLYRG